MMAPAVASGCFERSYIRRAATSDKMAGPLAGPRPAAPRLFLSVLLLVARGTCESSPPPLAQKVALAGGGVALVQRVSRGRPPPLRSIVGGREEATLVAEAPPRGFALFTRAITLLLIFLPVLLTAPLAFLGPLSGIWFWLVKSSLARAGTAFIKWGQWASVRPDMFPERLCASLAELHSRAPVHSFAFTKREVEASLGQPLGDVFSAFSEKPIASGSIAQVHKATLDGKSVAVKVRHPHVVRRIVTDFTLMRQAAETSARVPGLMWLNLKQSVEQFSGGRPRRRLHAMSAFDV